jgi:hypothetical protein
MVDKPGHTLAKGGFAELDDTDHAVDALHARVLASITDEGWRHGVWSATGLALVAGFYERFPTRPYRWPNDSIPRPAATCSDWLITYYPPRTTMAIGLRQ